MDSVDVILEAVENQHNNAEADGRAHRLAGLIVGPVGSTWQGLGLRFGGEPSGVL
jgi:hypothetical protein